MNLTDGATLMTAPIKRAKNRFSPKIKCFRVTQSDAYGEFQQTMVETHRLYRYWMRNVMEITFKGKFDQ